MTTRAWLGFGDLKVGDRFRWNYFGGIGGPAKLSPVVLVKTGPRKYRDDATGKVWSSRAGASVVLEAA